MKLQGAKEILKQGTAARRLNDEERVQNANIALQSALLNPSIVRGADRKRPRAKLPNQKEKLALIRAKAVKSNSSSY